MGTPTDSQDGAPRTTSARGPLGGLAAATSLFTILPAPMIADVDRRVATRAIRAFPWLGLCLGVVGGLIAGGVLAMGAGSWLAAILALVWLTGATGGFHLDGVADTADGLGSRGDPARALEIMKQSDIGPMGVIALVLTLLVDLGALSSLTGTAGALGAGSWWRVGLLVMLGPSVARAAIIVATMPSIPCARPGGFGSLVAGVSAPRTVAVNFTALELVWAALGWAIGGWQWAVTVAVATLVALGMAWLWIRHLVKRFGGLTGDCYGSINELTQTATWTLLALALAVVA